MYGVCIKTTQRDGSISSYFWFGTSYAAPHAAGAVAVCRASGACSGLSVAQIVSKIINDAEHYSVDNVSHRYLGDPTDPVPGKHFGYLVTPACY